MTNLLIKLFVKDYQNVQSKRVREGYGTMTSIVGIIVNLLLFVGKFTIGTLFGSVAISADAINNLSDAGSSFISLISFKISSKPADREHPFGHARIEYIASMIVSFIIMLVGGELFLDSAKTYFTIAIAFICGGRDMVDTPVVYAVMASPTAISGLDSGRVRTTSPASP